MVPKSPEANTISATGAKRVGGMGSATSPPPTKRKKQRSRTAVRNHRSALVQPDKLGEYVKLHAEWYHDLDWRQFIRKVRGRGDLQITDEARRSHPAGDLIKQFQSNGVPATLASAPWPQELKDARSQRGSHKSCDDHLDFLRDEILDYVEKGFWMLLPYRVLRHLTELRLSPMGVVPQRGRRPRLIVDYTFYQVNHDTLRLTPPEAMQFGRALERILYMIRHSNPKFGHVHLGKADLSDGFYRLQVADTGILKLAVAFPKYPNEEQLVALPLSLPMGWVDSPPAFCAVTETVADLANHHPRQDWPEHPLEQLAMTPPEEPEKNVTSAARSTSDACPQRPVLIPDACRIPPVLTPSRRPLQHYDVYVDDFILAFQGCTKKQRLHLRKLLHILDTVFRPLDPQDRPTRKHVVSVKKLLKGDACPSVTKTVLGWLINTVAGTIELPPHRQERLTAIFKYLDKRRSVPLRKWHKILGELRSMVIGIPGSRGLFSMLQLALKRVDPDGTIPIDQPMKDQIDDFRQLAHQLISRPTALAEIVPDHPVAVGPHDASGTGMGGV